ncbi:hypothetical protein, partial [Burkholderia gladioli]|uniref:hypothetical protein n=1 Tax=Burkholderia gladioli TaxID=28095 RepID=UPI00163E331C
AELLQQLSGNRRQFCQLGFRFARHTFSLGQEYASNTKLRTGPRAALSAKNVDLSTVMTEFNLGRYFDESDNLVSLGPFFGGDAADECMKSLEKLGLAYIEDFFIFEGFVPDWCSFEVF